MQRTRPLEKTTRRRATTVSAILDGGQGVDSGKGGAGRDAVSAWFKAMPYSISVKPGQHALSDLSRPRQAMGSPVRPRSAGRPCRYFRATAPAQDSSASRSAFRRSAVDCITGGAPPCALHSKPRFAKCRNCRMAPKGLLGVPSGRILSWVCRPWPSLTGMRTSLQRRGLRGPSTSCRAGMWFSPAGGA